MFSAFAAEDDDTRLRWSVVTVPDSKHDGASPAAALGRFRLPQAAQTLIEERISVNSSLMVSDRDPSHETGKGTDFILLTR